MTRPAAGEVTVVTVPGCHLCDEAIAAVRRTCEDAGVPWHEQDLFALGDEDVRRWRDLVPVVLVDGEVADTLRVDTERLRAALRAG